MIRPRVGIRQASSRPLPRPRSAIRPTTSPRAPSTSATIVRIDVPPLANDEIDSTLGAGVSELCDGVDQFTIEPSEYVCRTSNRYVLAFAVLALKRKTASSPVGTLPPLH